MVLTLRADFVAKIYCDKIASFLVCVEFAIERLIFVSFRLKQRPRGGFFDQITPISGIDESVIETHFGENAPKAKALLLNSQRETPPPSPALERKSRKQLILFRRSVGNLPVNSNTEQLQHFS